MYRARSTPGRTRAGPTMQDARPRPRPPLRPPTAAVAIVLAAFAAAAAAEPPARGSVTPCRVDEKSLVGAWASRGPAASFESIAFSVDDEGRVFQSWRHQRPEIGNGTWSLAGCVLRIGHATEPQLSWVFHVEGGPDGELRLREDGTRRQERYRRMP